MIAKPTLFGDSVQLTVTQCQSSNATQNHTDDINATDLTPLYDNAMININSTLLF